MKGIDSTPSPRTIERIKLLIGGLTYDIARCQLAAIREQSDAMAELTASIDELVVLGPPEDIMQDRIQEKKLFETLLAVRDRPEVFRQKIAEMRRLNQLPGEEQRRRR